MKNEMKKLIQAAILAIGYVPFEKGSSAEVKPVSDLTPYDIVKPFKPSKYDAVKISKDIVKGLYERQPERKVSDLVKKMYDLSVKAQVPEKSTSKFEVKPYVELWAN